MSNSTLKKSLSYAQTLLRRSDNDALWPLYFFPHHVRPAYLAIRALNVELSTINEQVSNAMVGRMRFQWWRDAIKAAYEGKPPNHPIAQLLSHTHQGLSPYHFTRLISAREQHFLNPSFPTLQSLADYSAGTQGVLMLLLLQALEAGGTSPSKGGGGGAVGLNHSKLFEHTGGEHPDTSSDSSFGYGSLDKGKFKGKGKEADPLTIDHAASHLAVTTTIAILLRSIPHHATKRINVIPTEIASRHDLREELLFRHGPDTPGLRESVATMVGIAEAELRTSRACFDGTEGVPERSFGAFLTATPARTYLERLSSDRVEFDVFDKRMQRRDWRLPFTVWGDARNRRY
ncbi:hypothetical protein T439DRAFT_330304 [Meredithblackwellia eburnea MCA 4105]